MDVDAGNVAELNAILRRLTMAQLRFVAARLHTATDKEASEELGFAESTVRNWPNKKEVNRALELAHVCYIKPIALEKLNRLVIPTIERLGSIVKNPESYDRDAIRAGAEILDRSDLSKKSILEANVTHDVAFTSETLLTAAERIKELERELFGEDDESDESDGGDDE